MAHSCPYCDQLCHCKGDIDDIDLGHQPAGGCIHYKTADCDQNDMWEDEEDFDDDFPDTSADEMAEQTRESIVNIETPVV